MTHIIDLTRRNFFYGAAAAGLVCGITGLPLQATAQGVSPPKHGGRCRIGQSNASTSDSFEPATLMAGPVLNAMVGGMCNHLAEIDVDGNIVPELAERIEPSADAQTWTFHLRKDVTFSNGKKLTPEDVIASYNHHRGKDTTSGAKAILAEIINIRKDGDNAVVFELKAGNSDFPFLTSEYQLVIMQDDGQGGLDWRSGIGTGGYVVEANEPGVRIFLKRRDDYWKKNRAWFDEVEILAINDSTARQNALITDQADVITGIDIKTLPLLQRYKDINLVEVTSLSHYTMPMFCDADPFTSLDVRLALKYAVDREDMVKKILRGHGRIGNDHPIAPANRFFAADLPQRRYDPDKAKFHLKAAGKEGLKVQIHTSNAPFQGAVDAAVLFQESAARAGIQVDVKREPEDGYWSNIWTKKPFCFCYWNGRPTEDSMFSLVYAKGAAWNDSHWDNDRFNKLLIEARSELNKSKRAEMYHEMQKIVSDDGGTIIPMFANYIDAHNKKVAHGKVAANRALDGWKIIERWWSVI